MNKSFTIVIPSYNSELTIEKTLLSIINTNYNQDLIEIFVIDDGSTDNSKNIVKNLSKKYTNIKLIEKSNGQWGSVINYAKNNNIIKNDYVSILDSDDFYHPEIFNILNKLSSKDADILCGSFRRYNGSKATVKVYPYWFLYKKNIINKFQMITPYCLPLPFFIKRELFCSVEDLTEGYAYQDPDYITKMFNKAKLVSFTRKTIGYYYFNRAGNSISQKWNDKRFEAELNACNKCIENNCQEMISYRLNLKDMNRISKEKNIKFKIDRKFKFSWYPFYIRWIYAIIHKIRFSKFFIKNSMN